MPHAEPQKSAAPSLSWAARLRLLELALAESPKSAQSWHWRAQIKVLRFLVSRYGNVLLKSTSYEDDTPSSIPDFPLPNPPYPPKSLASMQRLLSDVQRINDLKPEAPLPPHVLPDGTPAPLRFNLDLSWPQYEPCPSFLILLTAEIRSVFYKQTPTEQISRWVRIAAIACHLLVYLVIALAIVWIMLALI